MRPDEPNEPLVTRAKFIELQERQTLTFKLPTECFNHEFLLKARERVLAQDLQKSCTFYADGGTTGSSSSISMMGEGGSGGAIYLPDGKLLVRISIYCGKCTTNNRTEYVAIWKILELADMIGITHIKGFSDSLNCVQQLKGQYDVC